VSKKKSAVKLICGILVGGIGIAAAVFGGSTIHEGILGLQGKLHHAEILK
jgi:hypothetical protein